MLAPAATLCRFCVDVYTYTFIKTSATGANYTSGPDEQSRGKGTRCSSSVAKPNSLKVGAVTDCWDLKASKTRTDAEGFYTCGNAACVKVLSPTLWCVTGLRASQFVRATVRHLTCRETAPTQVSAFTEQNRVVLADTGNSSVWCAIPSRQCDGMHAACRWEDKRDTANLLSSLGSVFLGVGLPACGILGFVVSHCHCCQLPWMQQDAIAAVGANNGCGSVHKGASSS